MQSLEAEGGVGGCDERIAKAINTTINANIITAKFLMIKMLI